MTRVLAADVISWSDGGGKVSAALRPVIGLEAVIRLSLGITRKLLPSLSMTMAQVNGDWAILAWEDSHTLLFVLLFDFAGTQICGLRTILNPDKLRYIQEQFKFA